MNKQDIASRLRRLRQLLSDYTYPKRRSVGMLREIDSLLVWAMHDVVKVGASSAEIRKLIGEPHVAIGDQSAETWTWLYPCSPTQDEAVRAPNWFFALRFREDRLQLIERRGWIFEK